MCGTGSEHSHSDAAHGTLSSAEKTTADLRDDLGEVLKLVNKFEYQRAVINGADFPAAGEVVHTLEHILDDQKAHAAMLVQLINEIDVVQRNKFEGDEGNGHEHEHKGHEHTHEH
ncbi:MAG: hypothetical protein HZA12_04955 [Nitrospirae bacterium]|nr:hypothetical protein [Nitrospirota bacterium]